MRVSVWTDISVYDGQTMDLIRHSEWDHSLVLLEMDRDRYLALVTAVNTHNCTDE